MFLQIVFALRVIPLRYHNCNPRRKQPVLVFERFHSQPFVHPFSQVFFTNKTNKFQHNCCGYADHCLQRVLILYKQLVIDIWFDV